MTPCREHTQNRMYGHTTRKIGNVVKSFLLHRLAYEDAYGPIPDGHYVRHKCDNPRCINPEHLEVGTQLENMADCVSRNRTAKGERQGLSMISDEDAQEIYDRYIAGGISMQSLATEHGVTKFAISYIIRKRKSVCRYNA